MVVSTKFFGAKVAVSTKFFGAKVAVSTKCFYRFISQSSRRCITFGEMVCSIRP